MNEDRQHSKRKAEKAGPSGTQVFSRDQIADMIDRQAAPEETSVSSAHLLAVSSSVEGETFRLRADRLTIGRSSVCDIHIDEPSLSSEHARLVRSDDGWRIINLLSTNGVFVNDKKVFSHRLEPGDVIRLGRVSLRFDDPEAEARKTRRAGGARWVPWAVGIVVVGAAVAAVVWLLQ
ncbi:MAG: FHA domain-containing protein [Wenzhouxiangellaceae bacterium]|nr:FHA domain-containing protein [Wenzhouxiangellaceae bacterium]